jgi:hypothetical protein
MIRGMVFLIISSFVFSASATVPVAVSGKITATKGGKPVAGAIIKLKKMSLADTTDNLGAFLLSSSAVLFTPKIPNAENISFHNDVIIFNLPNPQTVSIEMFDMKGNVLAKIKDRPASAGVFRFKLFNSPLAAKMMVIRASIGNKTLSFRYLPMHCKTQTTDIPAASAAAGAKLAKIAATVDTLVISATGFQDKKQPIATYTQTVNITLDSVSTSGLAKFSFFVTSLANLQKLSGKDVGFGGDLRFNHTGQGAGLAGADSICQCLAEMSMPGSKVKKWRAFLSAKKGADGSQVDAIDRIGQGPWYDRLGKLVSSNIADLQNLRPASAEKVIKDDLPNEYGVPNHKPDPNKDVVDNHLTITGSDAKGRLYSSTYATDATCADWTTNDSTSTSHPRSGLSWSRADMFGGGMGGGGLGGGGLGGGGMGGGGMNMEGMQDMGPQNHWISYWSLPGCQAGYDLVESSGSGAAGSKKIGAGGGYGGFYCFALEP